MDIRQTLVALAVNVAELVVARDEAVERANRAEDENTQLRQAIEMMQATAESMEREES